VLLLLLCLGIHLGKNVFCLSIAISATRAGFLNPKEFFLVCLIWLPIFSYFSFNEPELGVGINPGIASTPLTSSIDRGLNSQPSDHEPSALPLDHSFCFS